MKQPDSILVEKAKQGDRQAFRQIVENTQGMVYQVAYRFLRQQHEAEDAVQEVYVKLWKNLPGYNPRAKLSTWLYRIVSNYCLDVLKSKSYKKRNQSYDLEKFQLNDPIQADHQLNQHEMSELILKAADQLTPVQKAVFILRDLEGLSVEDVCDNLSMKADSIKSNLYHARKKMFVLLKPYQNELL